MAVKILSMAQAGICMSAMPAASSISTLKAHDGFAANLASTLTDHSLDEKILNFEDAIGSTDADRIYGTAGANSLSGDFGNDQLYGLAGNELVLDGGWGDDDLYGGAGRNIMTGHDSVDSTGSGFGYAATPSICVVG